MKVIATLMRANTKLGVWHRLAIVLSAIWITASAYYSYSYELNKLWSDSRLEEYWCLNKVDLLKTASESVNVDPYVATKCNNERVQRDDEAEYFVWLYVIRDVLGSLFFIFLSWVIMTWVWRGQKIKPSYQAKNRHDKI